MRKARGQTIRGSRIELGGRLAAISALRMKKADTRGLFDLYPINCDPWAVVQPSWSGLGPAGIKGLFRSRTSPEFFEIVGNIE